MKIMAKKVVNLFKRLGRAYMKGATEYYKPFVDYKISPCI